MSNRSTPQKILSTNTDLDPDTDFSIFQMAANVLVENVLVPLGTLNDNTLTIVEIYLATHFATLDQMKQVFEGAGDMQNQYQHAEDVGFNSTPYGQMALRLDTSLTLARLEQKVKRNKGFIPGMLYIGRRPCHPSANPWNPYWSYWWWGGLTF